MLLQLSGKKKKIYFSFLKKLKLIGFPLAGGYSVAQAFSHQWWRHVNQQLWSALGSSWEAINIKMPLLIAFLCHFHKVFFFFQPS